MSLTLSHSRNGGDDVGVGTSGDVLPPPLLSASNDFLRANAADDDDNGGGRSDVDSAVSLIDKSAGFFLRYLQVVVVGGDGRC